MLALPDHHGISAVSLLWRMSAVTFSEYRMDRVKCTFHTH